MRLALLVLALAPAACAQEPAAAAPAPLPPAVTAAIGVHGQVMGRLAAALTAVGADCAAMARGVAALAATPHGQLPDMEALAAGLSAAQQAQLGLEAERAGAVFGGRVRGALTTCLTDVALAAALRSFDIDLAALRGENP